LLLAIPPSSVAQVSARLQERNVPFWRVGNATNGTGVSIV
jgi:hypothetical protein